MNSELFDTGIFPFATGQTPVWPAVEELAQLDTMIAAEDALERALDQAEQTYVRCDDAAPMLASILGMWCHLKQARHRGVSSPTTTTSRMEIFVAPREASDGIGICDTRAV